jgi:hypothetical protein
MLFTANGIRIRPAAGFVRQWVAVRSEDDGPVDAVACQELQPGFEDLEFCAKPVDS